MRLTLIAVLLALSTAHPWADGPLPALPDSPLTVAEVVLRQSTLYVNNTIACNDATPLASNSAVAPWCTPGRAMWGSTNKSSPNASEAAAAGDTVIVVGSTYDYTATCTGSGCRWRVLYNPVNNGTVGNPITLSCDGVCTLTAGDWNAPTLGSEGSNYFTLTVVDVETDYWDVLACGENPAAGDDCPSNTVAATPDTGPVVVSSASNVTIEGVRVRGYAPITYNDNWNAFRIEGSSNVTLRNVTGRDFSRNVAGGGNHNQSFTTIYYSGPVVIEHCQATNTNSGVFLKDNATASPQTDITVRYCTFDDVNEVFPVSLVNPSSVMSRGRYYQNVARNIDYFVRLVSDTDDGARDMVVANNIVDTMSMGFFAWGTDTGGVSGVRLVGNIVLGASTVLLADSPATWQAAGVMDVEHNAYSGYSTFYNGSDGSRTFASFNSAYPNAHNATPTAIAADALVVDLAGGDYRLCTGSGTPAAGCSGASPASALVVDELDLDGDASTTDTIPAGVLVTGAEVIGLNVTGGGGGGATVPDPPTIGAVTAGDGFCQVAFTPPGSDGGATITSYTATSSPGSITGTGSASPLTVVGLTRGQGYTFTVVATNSEGNSTASSASATCTPVAAASGGRRIRLTGEAEQAEDGSWSFSMRPEPEGPRGVPFACRVTGLITVYANGDIGPRVRCETGGALLPIGTAFTIPRQQ